MGAEILTETKRKKSSVNILVNNHQYVYAHLSHLYLEIISKNMGLNSIQYSVMHFIF